MISLYVHENLLSGSAMISEQWRVYPDWVNFSTWFLFLYQNVVQHSIEDIKPIKGQKTLKYLYHRSRYHLYTAWKTFPPKKEPSDFLAIAPVTCRLLYSEAFSPTLLIQHSLKIGGKKLKRMIWSVTLTNWAQRNIIDSEHLRYLFKPSVRVSSPRKRSLALLATESQSTWRIQFPDDPSFDEKDWLWDLTDWERFGRTRMHNLRIYPQRVQTWAVQLWFA